MLPFQGAGRFYHCPVLSFLFTFQGAGSVAETGGGIKSSPSVYRRKPAHFGRNGEMAKGRKSISAYERGR
jgi:hypothetical protein